MIHIFWAEQYGIQLPEQRKGEVQLRSVASKLERIAELDPRPLDQARPPDKRLVGNCRDFSVLLTAMLQHQGVPARARCGFGRYFLPDQPRRSLGLRVLNVNSAGCQSTPSSTRFSAVR